MIEFLKRMFGQSGSSSTAKERLRLVLMSDHLSLAPELVEQLKIDLVEVISRYVEVDRTKIEVSFEQQDSALAMLANIPILAVNRPKVEAAAPAAASLPAAHASVAGDDPNAPASAALPRRKRRKKPASKAVTVT